MAEHSRESRDRKTRQEHDKNYFLEGISISTLTYSAIAKHSSAEAMAVGSFGFNLQPIHIEVNAASISGTSPFGKFPTVAIVQEESGMFLSCECTEPKKQLCQHQSQVLQTLLNRQDLRAFFDAALRREKIKPVAAEYGLDQEHDLDQFFTLEYDNKSLLIKPRLTELLPVTEESQVYLKERLLPSPILPSLPKGATVKENTLRFVVLSEHKYYKHLTVELLEAATTLAGKVKNPVKVLNPLDYIWHTDKPDELKFYSALSRFQNSYPGEPSEVDAGALYALVHNPLGFPMYQHLPDVSTNITASSITPVQVLKAPLDLVLEVQVKDQFYTITPELQINGQVYSLNHLNLKFGHFIEVNDSLYLLYNPDLRRVIDFFQRKGYRLLVHASKFEEFRQNVLANLEAKIKVTYAFLKPATPQQLKEQGFDEGIEKLIYLSDSDDFVLLTPVMRYGHVEVPVLSRKQIYATDLSGQTFTVVRDEYAEAQLTAAILKEHAYFQEQLHLDCFYLHKDRFLIDDWFLNAFESWREQGITILGFKDLSNIRLNPNKAKVTILVTSGINWFDTSVNVQFGNEKVSLKHLHKSLRNKNRFVTLDDGTQGILPIEWIERLQKYFAAGEVVGEYIRTPKINFTAIEELYESEVLSSEVKGELSTYKTKLSNFKSIPEVEVPEELTATLRPYQKEGLNWLSFLDQFNFGGCLADDMGLGKTIQVLAFILSQRKKRSHNTNLVVVPTSLLFNWQEEVTKFASSLKVLTIYGNNRISDLSQLDGYEIVLTTYGTLLSDIMLLKGYQFNYIFLDESQAIKNPESQRYRAVRLLQARNRIVMTGTPLENNTYDLYGQLSFACTGLLGNKRYFRDHYSKPIDQFKSVKHAKELQRKISPFLLRRTKEQVAQELPEKTEMVLYCEMGKEQRQIYALHEREIRDFISSQEDAEITKNSMHVLRGLTKLRQICNSPVLLPEEEATSGSIASAKMEVLLEQIESKAPHHKILVFSQFVSMLKLIEKELTSRGIKYEILTGKTKDRATVVNNFQNQEDVRVFLISLKAGGTGLNLTRADYVYLVDPWWNPAVENQAIDRTYRIGQQKNVVAVRLICPDTVEEKIQQLQSSKKDLAKDLIKTDGAFLKTLSKQDLLNLLR